MISSRKTRSMAPGRHGLGRLSPSLGFKVSKESKDTVKPTYDATYQDQILALKLDEEDPIVAASLGRQSSLPKCLEDVPTSDKTTEDSVGGKLFRSLPLETHQMIVDFLQNDSDVIHFAAVSKETNAAVSVSVWRKRFERTYDPLPNATTTQLKIVYRHRESISRGLTIFDLKKYGSRISDKIRVIQKEKQGEIVDLLRALILESDAKKTKHDDGYEQVWGLNFDIIQAMVSGPENRRYVDIVDSILNVGNEFGPKEIVSSNLENTLIYVIQLILTPFSLNPSLCNGRVSHFDESQEQAYATSKVQPMFTGKWKQNINVLWMLSTVNFFKFHFKSQGEGILAYAFKDLERDQYPQPWTGHIKPGTQPLGKFWKGAHTYMDDSERLDLRLGNRDEWTVFSDALDLGETFQDMELFFDEAQFPSKSWPKAWEEVLHSDPFKDFRHNLTLTQRTSPRRNKNKYGQSQSFTKPDVQSFYGISEDTKTTYIYGRIHAMPQQQGIHGFQRIVVMKFYLDTKGNIDLTQHYCYEGCVLPGGTVIVGRWWLASEDPKNIHTTTGPFIWWNVDRSALGPISSAHLKNMIEFAQQCI